jgi:Uma2 family endonuclease
MSTLVTETSAHYEVVSQMPPDTVVTFHGASWDDYEDLLDQVGEASALRISYDDGELEVMTLSTEHEKYARFLEKLMAAISLRLRINILSFGSATMRKRRADKGKEPDACYYVRTAEVIGNRIQLDLNTDPPPDIAVEIDIHHDSLSKFPIYAALGVPELWRYDGDRLTIYQLQQDQYVAQETSLALPMLTSTTLTQFLTRMRVDGEFQTILAFDEWLAQQQ